MATFVQFLSRILKVTREKSQYVCENSRVHYSHVISPEHLHWCLKLKALTSRKYRFLNKKVEDFIKHLFPKWGGYVLL